MSAPAPVPTRRQLKVVCPHDCPDTCVMTVDVEGGGRSRSEATPTTASRRAFSAPRSTTTSSASTAPSACSTRCGGWAGRARAASSRSRGTRRSTRWRGACGRSPPARAAGHPALLLRGQHGPARLRQHGPALLPRARGEPPRPDDLRHGRGARLQGHRREDRWASTPRPSSTPAHRGLGREHRQLERAPLALRRGGAPAGGAARVRRPLPLAHGREAPTSTSPRFPGPTPPSPSAMMHVIFRDGLEDRDWLERHAVGARGAA